MYIFIDIISFQVDYRANQVLNMSGETTKISQMPIVLIPIHFDRSNIERTTSFQRSVVIRPFITEDFMTGVPAIPGKDISLEVNGRVFCTSNYITLQ